MGHSAGFFGDLVLIGLFGAAFVVNAVIVVPAVWIYNTGKNIVTGSGSSDNGYE